MFPKQDSLKIAIITSEKINHKEIDQKVTWFNNIKEVNQSAFDFVIDCNKEEVSVLYIKENRSINIETVEKKIVLQELVSILTDEKYVDLDLDDILSIIGDESNVAIFEGKTEEVIDDLSKHEEKYDSCFVYVRGDISLIESERIVKSLACKDIQFAVSINEKMNQTVRVSIWY